MKPVKAIKIIKEQVAMDGYANDKSTFIGKRYMSTAEFINAVAIGKLLYRIKIRGKQVLALMEEEMREGN